MVKFLIFRPISVIVLIFGFLCLSGLNIRQLNIALLPDIGIPEILILVEAPQFSPLELEEKALTPIRRTLSAVNGLKDIESVANWGSGELRLKFDYGIEMDKAFIETNEMVDLSMNNLPQDIDRPRVISMRAEDLPVYYLSLQYKPAYQGSDFILLSEYARGVLRRRLEQLSEIALVDVHGIKNMQIAIQPNEEKLSALGLDQQDIQQSLMASQMNLTSVVIKERSFQYLVRIGKPLMTVRDIQQARIAVGNRLLRISDLAKVTIEPQMQTGAFEEMGQPGISLAIVKSPNVPLNQLEHKLDAICNQILKERPDLELLISRDQTQLLRTTINNLRNSLILGCILAIGIVFLFYGQWRIPIIIGVIVPVSLLLSLLFFKWLALSLNMISLSGLLLGLGLMIDNGIIVLDNISRKWLEQNSLVQACIEGTNEMVRPLLTSMLTTCSVFFPLVMISGISGALFWDQALSISIGLGTSYLVSIILLPTLYYAILKKTNLTSIERNNWFTHQLKGLYKSGFEFTFNRAGWVLGLIGMLLITALFLLKRFEFRRFPNLPETAFNVEIDWNAPIQPEVSALRIREIFKNINVSWQAHIGISQYLLNSLYDGDINSASIYIKTPKTEKNQKLKSIIKERIATLFPQARVRFLAEKNVFEMVFPRLNKENVLAKCFVNETDEQLAQSLYQRVFKEISNISEVDNLFESDYDKTYWIEPKLENLFHYQVDENRLIEELKKLLSANELLELKSFQYSVPVVVKSDWNDISVIKQQGSVQNKEGIQIPMHQLIEVHTVRSLRKIEASKAGRFWPIRIVTDQPEKVETQINTIEQQFPSVNIEVSGAYKANQVLIREIIYALLISIVLLYFLLTAQFESFLQPLIILLEIPISLAGSLLFLWVFHASINVLSLIGMVVTIGIIINDSIIKIDTFNRLYRRNLNVKSVIHEAGMKRLNPIIMTSLTTILAVLPFLWGEDLGSRLQRPLAISLIGGMIIGTLVSLYVIPLFYYFIYNARKN